MKKKEIEQVLKYLEEQRKLLDKIIKKIESLESIVKEVAYGY
jgi:hypothetical protein